MSIPFRLPDINGGLTEIQGLVYLDEEFLVFEIETALFGEFNKRGQTVKIEPAAIQQIRLDPGVVRDRLCIRPKKNDLLEAVPGTHLGELRLKIWRKYRPEAERLVAGVLRRQ